MNAEDIGLEAAAQTLSRDLAARLGITARSAFDVLCDMPDNILDLLASPEGWTVLANFIGGSLGLQPRDYAPTVH